MRRRAQKSPSNDSVSTKQASFRISTPVQGGSDVVAPAAIKPFGAGVLLQSFRHHAKRFDHARNEKRAAAIVVRNVRSVLVGGPELKLQLVGKPAEALEAHEQSQQAAGGEIAVGFESAERGDELHLASVH